VSSLSPCDKTRCNSRKNFLAHYRGTYQIVPEALAFFWPRFVVLVESLLHLINKCEIGRTLIFQTHLPFPQDT